MRNTLRGFVVLLSMCFCISLYPAGILSAAANKGTCGDGLKWECAGDKLVITYTGLGSGTMDNFEEIEDTITRSGNEEYVYHYSNPWNSYRDDITEVVISSGVTTIGNHAFAAFKNLKTVNIPEGVTEIGEGAFEDSGFSGGIRVVIPGTVKEIGKNAFNGSTLVSAVISEGVKTIGWGAFMDCAKLRSINIPNSVTTIENFAFYRCKSLVRVGGGAGLETIGASAFAYCTKLKMFSINSTVLNRIGHYAFNQDKSLKVLNIRKTSKLTKDGVEKSLKGSRIKRVRVRKASVKAYKKIFKKSNSGKKVSVKK